MKDPEPLVQTIELELLVQTLQVALVIAALLGFSSQSAGR